MRTIKLYGELGKRFGKIHRFEVRTAGEAIRALCANFPEFRSYLGNAHNQGIGFGIVVGNEPVHDYPEVDHPSNSGAPIKVIPLVFGSGNGWVKVLVGAVLVVAGAVATAFGFGAVGGPLIAAGAGLIIGGVAQLLTKPPGPQNAQETRNRTSFIFNGPVNVSAQGGAIPVGYGRMIVGSTVISAGIEAYDET